MTVAINGSGPITGAYLSPALAALGQCRFDYATTTTCKLTPYKGNQLTINGVNYTIPSAGVTLSSTGLTVATTYYVYAWMNGSTMTLEASTTGWSRDTTYGVEIKTGDSSRTLVGMVRPTTGPNFLFSADKKFVISWYNQKPIDVANSISSNVPYGGTTPAGIVTIEFLTWGGAISAATAGAMQQTNAASVTFTGFGIDTPNTSSTTANYWQAYTASAWGSFAQATTLAFTEGYHYLVAVSWVNSGTVTHAAGNEIRAQILG